MEERKEPEKDTVSLNVISPTLPPVLLPDLPTTTSINELKERIYHASPAHPPTQAQRLIYRGHPLSHGQKTLREILSQDVLVSGENVTLHLVTPPVHTANTVHPVPQTGPSPNNPQQGPEGPRTSQHNVQQHNAQGAFLLPHPAPMPPGTQVTFSAVFNGQPANIQIHPQQHHQHQPTSRDSTPHTAQNGPHGPQNTQQQPHPPAPIQLPGVPPQMLSQFQHQMQHFSALQAQSQLLAQQLAAMQQHPAFAHQMPNVPVAMMPNAPNLPPHVSQARSPPHQTPTNLHGSAPQIPSSNEIHPAPANSGRSPSLPHPDFAGNSRPSGLPSGTSTAFQRYQVPPNMNISPRFGNYMQQSLPPTPVPSVQPRATAPQSNSNLGPQTDHPRAQSQNEASNPQHAAVYLLSSPNGPQALLVSPAGQYIAPWITPSPPQDSTRRTNVPQNIPADTSTPHSQHANASSSRNPRPPSNPQPNEQGQAIVGQGARQPNQQADAAANQREIARMFLQFSSHLWMLIRMIGFIWFFSHGASQLRITLLCTAAFVVFLFQVGLFRPLWQAVRRRTDNLLPLGNPEPQNGNPRRGNSERSPNDQARLSTGPSAPRLSEQGPGQDDSLARQTFRRFERATALFLASLAPGVAERHIQAREAAEAARQREIRQQEESSRSEEEAQKPHAHEQNTHDVDAENNVTENRNAVSTTPNPGDDAAGTVGS